MNYIKNSIKLFLLGIITPLLCGVSFGATFQDDFDDYIISSGINYNTDNRILSIDTNNTNDKLYCVSFSGTYQKTKMDIYYNTSNDSSPGAYLIRVSNSLPDNTVVCNWGNKRYFNIYFYTLGLNIDYKVYDFGAFLSATNNGGGISCDYSEYESTITTLSGNLATCNTNLNNCLNSNCDTQLSQCIIDRDNALSSITTLSGSLASCNEDKSSLQNYNNSLNSQLNQCLLGGSGENLSGSCIDYSLFWTDLDTNYSLPITNNLFLPNGYKGKYNEDNVLSIAKINTLETAYQFSDDDKITIIDLLSMVMLFLLATGSLIGIILFLKRLIIKK